MFHVGPLSSRHALEFICKYFGENITMRSRNTLQNIFWSLNKFIREILMQYG